MTNTLMTENLLSFLLPVNEIKPADLSAGFEVLPTPVSPLRPWSSRSEQRVRP